MTILQAVYMASNSFYLLYRGWMNNPIFRQEPFTDREAWLWLIENALYKSGDKAVGNVIVKVQRGSLATSYRELKKTWGWGQKRIDGYIKKLKLGGMLGTQMGTPCLLISITKYDTYQDGLGTRKDRVLGTRMGTPISNNKENKVKESPPAQKRVDFLGKSEAVDLLGDLAKKLSRGK